MAQYIGSGTGKDGTIDNSGVINSYASMSASSGGRTVTTALSVVIGDAVLLHQTQGTGHGRWEVVFVVSAGSGDFTADRDLVNDYSGVAQAVLLPQYTGGSPSGILTCAAWNGTVGGIFGFLSTGAVNGNGGGSVNLTAKGFRGGLGGNDGAGTAGEGWNGTHGHTSETYDNGGGAGDAIAGGGGGQRTKGTKDGTGGYMTNAGLVASSADGTLMDLGGGSGGSSVNDGYQNGVIGGGIGFIFSSIDELPLISDGTEGIDSPSHRGSGGSAGGFFFCKGSKIDFGTGLSHCEGKEGGEGVDAGATGGTGGDGGFRVEACKVSGTTSPLYSKVEGGFSFCGSVAQII